MVYTLLYRAGEFGLCIRVQRVTTVGDETLNTPVYVQVDSTRCHVMCDVAARYALIGQPREAGSRAGKLLRIAAFAPDTRSADCSLRVYCVDDTIDAVQVD